MPRQIDQRERLALVQMVEDAGLVGTQQPACPGITDMPRVTGKVDAGIKLHQLSRGIARHAQRKVRPNSLICQIKLNGCGYFLATRKAAKNQVILGVAAAEMAGNSRVIEVREEYP